MTPQQTDLANDVHANRKIAALVRQLQRIRANLTTPRKIHPILFSVLNKLEHDLQNATLALYEIEELATELEAITNPTETKQ